MSEIKNNLQFKDDKLHLEDEVVMKKVSGIPVNQEDETGTIDVNANINIGGSTSINGDVTVKGSVTIEGTSYKVIENPEYVWAIIDNDDKILCGIKTSGKFVADVDGIDEKIQEAINQMQTIIDEAQASIDEKIAAIDEKFDFISWIEDPEGRSEITTDSEGKVISYRDAYGVKHEEVGIITNNIQADNLELPAEGLTDLEKALKKNGFSGGQGDWSDAKSLEIAEPRCIVINITNSGNTATWPTDKTTEHDYIMQFWDMQGNYFKKNIIATGQGQSSMGMPKKNLAMDICNDEWEGDDTFSLKIGNWVAQDSFHLKAYWADYFVGVCPIGYKIYDKMLATRDLFTNRDWKKHFLPDNIGEDPNALADFDDIVSIGNSVRCYPDGIPAIVFLNKEFYGVYSFQLKKHRDNYMMDRNDTKHIHLDGRIDWDTIFNLNGELDWDVIGGTKPGAQGYYDGFEIRNPKPKKSKWVLTCANGSTYDADNNRKEIMGSDNAGYDSTNNNHVKSNKVKQALITLSTYTTVLKNMEDGGSSTEDIRSKIAELFDVQGIIDYVIFGDVTCNWDGYSKNWQWITWDGKKWFVEPYDLDGILGWNGWFTESSNRTLSERTLKTTPIGWVVSYYNTELLNRYKELRDLGVISVQSIMSILQSWIDRIGTDNFEENHSKWPIDNSEYASGPEVEHKDNVYRVSNWLTNRFIYCDNLYNYNQN